MPHMEMLPFVVGGVRCDFDHDQHDSSCGREIPVSVQRRGSIFNISPFYYTEQLIISPSIDDECDQMFKGNNERTCYEMNAAC